MVKGWRGGVVMRFSEKPMFHACHGQVTWSIVYGHPSNPGNLYNGCINPD